MTKKLHIHAVVFIIIFLMLAIIGGCGKKAPPVPPIEKIVKSEELKVKN